MEANQILYFLLGNVVSVTPQLIVIIVGIILSFTRLSKFQSVAKIALAGLGILLLEILVSLALRFFQMQFPFWYRDSIQVMIYLNMAINVVLSLLWTLGLGLLVYGIWIGREEKPR